MNKLKSHSRKFAQFASLLLFACFACFAGNLPAAEPDNRRGEADSELTTRAELVTKADPSFSEQISVSLETFGTYSVARGPFEDVLKNGLSGGTFGTGIAVNTFYGDHVGLKLDAIVPAVDDARGSLFDYTSLSFVLRFPTPIRLDPYGLAGVGRNWETDRWNTHVGVGTAFRLTDNVSVLGELRHIFESRGADYTQIRAGLSYKF